MNTAKAQSNQQRQQSNIDSLAAMADADVFVLYGAGDQRAARELTNRLTPRVYQLALFMTGHIADAEDITQEAMLRLWQAAGTWQHGPAQISTWLYRVTRNLCTDCLRTRVRKQASTLSLDSAVAADAGAGDNAMDVLDIADIADDAPHALVGLQQNERARALHKALEQLPARQSQALVMRYFNHLPSSEIAVLMNTNRYAIDSLLARGKRAMAAVLSRQYADLAWNGIKHT